MPIIYLDFETYWDSEFTLSRLDPVTYVTDPRLQVHGASVALDDCDPVWVPNDPSGTPAAFAAALDRVIPPDLWERSALCAWNCRFDASVLVWRVGRRPRAYLDPMAMARALVGHRTSSVSLSAVARLLLGEDKHAGVVESTKGLSTADLHGRPSLMTALSAYAVQDLVLCRRLFRLLAADMPRDELHLVDALVRVFVEPVLGLDEALLSSHVTALRHRRDTLLARLGLTSTDLRSDARLAALLRERGVEPPTKISPRTGEVAYAFAKTDEAFTALADDETVPADVRDLVAARLALKSSGEETRAERLLKLSRIRWPEGRSLLPVPLAYSAAHTHRLGGDYRINLQNLGRGSPIRKAIVAPPGCVIVAADAAQIEARIVAWLAGQEDLVEAFAQGRDVYSEFASRIYDREINKRDHPDERFIGKVGVLSLGFGASGVKLARTVRLLSQGRVAMDAVEGDRVVQVYRSGYSRIPLLWQRCLLLVEAMATGQPMRLGPVRAEREALLLPSGLRLHYPSLRHDGDGWCYTNRKGATTRIWHGLICENIVQALARICVMDARLRASRRLGGNATFVLTVHDELVYVTAEGNAETTRAVLVEEMSRPPEWGAGLPLMAEAGVGRSYGDAK